MAAWEIRLLAAATDGAVQVTDSGAIKTLIYTNELLCHLLLQKRKWTQTTPCSAKFFFHLRDLDIPPRITGSTLALESREGDGEGYFSYSQRCRGVKRQFSLHKEWR